MTPPAAQKNVGRMKRPENPPAAQKNAGHMKRPVTLPAARKETVAGYMKRPVTPSAAQKEGEKMGLLEELFARSAECDTVVFDIGNTLMRFDTEEIMQKLIGAEYRDRIRHALFVPDHTWRWSCFDEGLVPNDELALNIVREEGLPDEAAGEIMYALDHFHELKKGLPLSLGIPRLKEEGKRLLALTNYATPQIDYCWERFDFFRYFDGRVVSSEEKVTKPDPRIFRILTERYHVTPENALFIDDAAANTEAAAALGFKVWNGVFF